MPEAVRTFAIYDAQGKQVASWGLDAPNTIERNSSDPMPSSLIVSKKGGWIEFIRVLQPLRSRVLLGPDDPDDRVDPRMFMGPPMHPRQMQGFGDQRLQGYLFLKVNDAPLEARLWAWRLGEALGGIAWAGFLGFVGVLWFRARRYQSTLIEHRELLQFAEASRTLSHELQNPLAAILLQTALLKRTSRGDTAAEVSIIEEEAQRMSGLVKRVRDFLKDPKGQAEIVDLGELATSLRERFATEVKLTIEGVVPYLVKFDPHRLRSVVENLIKNAVESGPDPRPQVVFSRPRPGTVRLEVLDSGSGFTADSLKQALNPFYTTKTTGTGIGLSIADGFVRAAGGKMKLENRPEGGARVSIDLPEVAGNLS